MVSQSYQPRNYRNKFNTTRFRGFHVSYLETDLWIGVDPDSFQTGMEEAAFQKVKDLRLMLDSYIQEEPEFVKSLIPFSPAETAPVEAKEMAWAAARAGIGPMASVAGLFAREVGETICQNFSAEELVIENGGDIFARLKKELVLSIYAGTSPLSEKIGIGLPAGMKQLGICTSSGTVGPSLSFGKADAVAVACEDVLLADAFATALGNEVKSPDEIQKALKLSEKFPEIISVVILCEDKVGVRGSFEIKYVQMNKQNENT
jgi:uncharacterized protein